VHERAAVAAKESHNKVDGGSDEEGVCDLPISVKPIGALEA
jgi:hypothetical protein